MMLTKKIKKFITKCSKQFYPIPRFLLIVICECMFLFFCFKEILKSSILCPLSLIHRPVRKRPRLHSEKLQDEEEGEGSSDGDDSDSEGSDEEGESDVETQTIAKEEEAVLALLGGKS